MSLFLSGGCVTPSPLRVAIDRNDVPAMRSALADGASVDARFSDAPYTPVDYACSRGRFEALKILVEKGANLGPRRSKNPHLARSAITLCVMHRRLEMVRYLVEHGAAMTERDFRLARTRPEVMAYMLSVTRKPAADPAGSDPAGDELISEPPDAPQPAAKPWWQ